MSSDKDNKELVLLLKMLKEYDARRATAVELREGFSSKSLSELGISQKERDHQISQAMGAEMAYEQAIKVILLEAARFFNSSKK